VSANVDEIFAALRDQAERVPGGTAVEARQRGAQRSRRRAMVVGALAVCLVAASTAVFFIAAPKSRPVTPAEPRGVAQVGPALPFGVAAKYSHSALGANSAYTAWQSTDGEVGVLAADIDTGKQRWRVALPGRFNEFRGVVALPRAVMVVAGQSLSDSSVWTAFILDPATGQKRWLLPYVLADDLVYYDDLLVQQVAATGETRAYDWTTGAVKWRLPPGKDRPNYTLGMYVPADAQRVNRPSGTPTTFSDRRLVQLTRLGRAQVRDAGTGQLIDTRMAAVFNKLPPIAYDGRVYSPIKSPDGPEFAIRATAMVGPPETKIVYSGSSLKAFGPCGAGRVCVAEGGGSGRLVAVDVTTGQQAWHASAPADSQVVQFLGQGILVIGSDEQVLYSPDGKRLASARTGLGRLDDATLLQLPSTAGLPIVRISAASGTRQTLGPMPVDTSWQCAWRPDRLVCPGISAVRTWSLPR
jgi:outer membrane protein assembly factor BamB